MALSAGRRVGPFEIVSSLGAGGMGEVYRARDSKLQRDVAIKILPELLALEPDRLARFSREAQLLAAPNHPHIASIYGLEEFEGPARYIPGEGYDVSTDGKRFVMVQRDPSAPPIVVSVVLNWFDELRARVSK